MTRKISARSMVSALSLTGLSALGLVAALAALGPDWAAHAHAPATCAATRC